MTSSDAGATSSSISSPTEPSPMPTLSPAPSLTPSPVSTTSDNSNHRPFAGGLLSTPVRLNVTQAAKAVGKGRSTLNRDIDSGKVSVTRNGKGQPFIDIAE